MDTAQACACMCPSLYTHTHTHTHTHTLNTHTADSLTAGAHARVHTFRNTHRRRLWEVESESSRPELWVVLLS
jgi:hypothetical protein